MNKTIISLALLLTGCETTSVVQKSANIYEISSSVEAVTARPGIQGAQDQLNGLAKQKCPGGWKVLDEQSSMKSGKQFITRTISCN